MVNTKGSDVLKEPRNQSLVKTTITPAPFEGDHPITRQFHSVVCGKWAGNAQNLKVQPETALERAVYFLARLFIGVKIYYSYGMVVW